MRPNSSCLQTEERGEEEGEVEGGGVKSEEDSVGIRKKASLALVETLMRAQIHYWLINHDTRDMEGGRKGGEAEQEGGEGEGRVG